MGLLGGNDVVATLYVVTQRKPTEELVDVLRDSLADADLLAGVSELPNACGVAVRLLGRTSRSVRAALRQSWQASRLALLGAPAPDLRKG